MSDSKAVKKRIVVTWKKDGVLHERRFDTRREKIQTLDPFPNCKGKQCGKGILMQSNIWVCPHNSLPSKFPELIKEWHPDNESIYHYRPGSKCKVLWICPKNPCGCHIYKTTIRGRTTDKTGCPYCCNRALCKHNNLKALHPEFIHEWHPDNRPMNEYSSCSGERVKWICSKNLCGCHQWYATIANRVSSGTGCPYCTNKTTCVHNNLKVLHPELIDEWHPDNKSMDLYLPGSDDKVSWICSKNPCGCHEWTTTIYERSTKKSSCPYCCNRALCRHNNLKVLHPELIDEWHPDNYPMEEYSSGSNKKVKWICSENPCGCHIYESTIVSRAIDKTGCPYCCNLALCKHNNLKVHHPELIEEWHSDNKSMKLFAPKSSKKVKWICRVNKEHIWTATIVSRTDNGNGCPHCVSRGYSKAQIKWIKYIEEKEGITIRNALSPEGEFSIPRIGKVDGYCEETNTVYEFHGDYWHGNPLLFDKDDIHRVNNKTYGELYDKTIKRDQHIRECGYNLVTIWEADYKKLKIE